MEAIHQHVDHGQNLGFRRVMLMAYHHHVASFCVVLLFWDAGAFLDVKRSIMSAIAPILGRKPAARQVLVKKTGGEIGRWQGVLWTQTTEH